MKIDDPDVEKVHDKAAKVLRKNVPATHGKLEALGYTFLHIGVYVQEGSDMTNITDATAFSASGWPNSQPVEVTQILIDKLRDYLNMLESEIVPQKGSVN